MRDTPEDVPAPPPVTFRRAWPLPLGIALAFLVLSGALLLFLFDPAEHALYPVCLFKKMTGYDCPGCGGLRAVHRLMHGEAGEAIRLNALAVIALPLIAVWAIRTWVQSSRTMPSRKSNTAFWGWLLLAVVVLFGVLRNLPFWPFGVTPM